jgi:hypothetical protein
VAIAGLSGVEMKPGRLLMMYNSWVFAVNATMTVMQLTIPFGLAGTLPVLSEFALKSRVIESKPSNVGA